MSPSDFNQKVCGKERSRKGIQSYSSNALETALGMKKKKKMMMMMMMMMMMINRLPILLR